MTTDIKHASPNYKGHPYYITVLKHRYKELWRRGCSLKGISMHRNRQTLHVVFSLPFSLTNTFLVSYCLIRDVLYQNFQLCHIHCITYIFYSILVVYIISSNVKDNKNLCQIKCVPNNLIHLRT